MWRADSLEMILMLGKIEGKRRRGWQSMRWLDSIYHRLNGHEFEQPPGDSDEEQGSLVWGSPRGHRVTSHSQKRIYERISPSFLKCISFSCSDICCSVTKSCPTLCDPMDSSKPGFPVLHCLSEFAQDHVHSVSDASQPSHPLSPPSPPALNLSQHQGLFQRVDSSHQVAKVLELQVQHHSFQWIFRVDFL